MATNNLLVRNLTYDRVRAVISGSQSSQEYIYYSEGDGSRYYVESISGTAAATMESATFNSFLSFTMSGYATASFNFIPMFTGNSVIIETIIYAQNDTATKGFVQQSFGGFKHSGATLSVIGGSINNTTKTDFTTVAASWTASGTQSIRLTCVGQTSENLDWDIHIRYTKGFHTTLSGTSSVPPNNQNPIYPDRRTESS